MMNDNDNDDGDDDDNYTYSDQITLHERIIVERKRLLLFQTIYIHKEEALLII